MATQSRNFTDLQLQQAVIDELDFEPALDSTHVTALVEKGVVTLSGYVGDSTQKHAAEQAVRRIRNVRAVAQEIEVRLPGDRKIADDEIAMRAAKLLEWDLRLPPGSIQVTVEGGVVRLRGTVRWEFQRREAESDMRKLGGVTSVINEIAVHHPSQDATVQDRIRAAFSRAADIEADRITIRVDDSGATIRLGGRVQTMLERATAENAAWSAPGVCRVVNEIAIEF